MDISEEIGGHYLEYIDDGHIYVVDGVIVPSITQVLKYKFGHKYDHVNKGVLNEAAKRGTAVHEAIEKYCKTGEECDLKELRNYKFLAKKYGFEAIENEVAVILSLDDEPIAAGRLDMVIKMDGRIGGADIKRTSTLDKESVTLQLNLYRIAYRQCYGIEWEFLRAIHLREDTRRFVDLPINEEYTMKFIREYMEAQ